MVRGRVEGCTNGMMSSKLWRGQSWRICGASLEQAEGDPRDLALKLASERHVRARPWADDGVRFCRATFMHKTSFLPLSKEFVVILRAKIYLIFFPSRTWIHLTHHGYHPHHHYHHPHPYLSPSRIPTKTFKFRHNQNPHLSLTIHTLPKIRLAPHPPDSSGMRIDLQPPRHPPALLTQSGR